MEASHQLRLAVRGVITVQCLAAVFLFLFFPQYAGYATFSLPMLVVAFAGLRLVGKVTGALCIPPRRSKRVRRGRWAVAVVNSGSGFGVSGMVGFSLASVAVVGATYELPYVGFAAAVLLMLAVLDNRPGRGLFPGITSDERRGRLRRQTLETLARATSCVQLGPAGSYVRIDREQPRPVGAAATRPAGLEVRHGSFGLPSAEIEIEDDELHCYFVGDDLPTQWTPTQWCVAEQAS
ncbi:hypothetical protein [Stieleria maiorica]|uniref:hypothetical protein n=1 Tax=Stieleria maiorica TaxID=2795974 RepID=UPI0011CB19C8|nr:hypothetical protein [Stieleria maiorica]